MEGSSSARMSRSTGCVHGADRRRGLHARRLVRPVHDTDRDEWAKVEFVEALGTEALLFGRRSNEWFAARWSSRDRRVGGQVEQPAQVRRVLDAVDLAWSRLDRPGGRRGRRRGLEAEAGAGPRECRSDASCRARWRTLIEHDLVDELPPAAAPGSLLGAGERLFGETGDKKCHPPPLPPDRR